MKRRASWTVNRFICAALLVGARVIIVNPLLDVLAGVRTFKNHLGHAVSSALRSDNLLICRKAAGRI